uniref:Flap endonuclease GEN-like 1 n=1 Tax=Plectus sambesii TaxID=2011161 RepID=A0A914W4W0_9BILA
MGVKDLWSILEPVRERRPLDDLDGESLAVDLGFWVCQMQTAVRSAASGLQKIYLRNLFFRIAALLQRNMRLFLVADGKPPDLKKDTMRRRIQQQQGKRPDPTAPSQQGQANRSRFMGVMKECCELIALMGLPVFQLDGEAEATCATLNQDGIAAAVITDDSDAFLYGASTVLRNFSLEGKQPTVDCYRMERIEKELGLDREKLVCLALLLGCDYGEKGVPGVGKETAMRFLSDFHSGRAVLDRMREWNDTFRPTTAAESAVFKRVLSVQSFPNEAIVEEYLKEQIVPLHMCDFTWTRPKLTDFILFMGGKLEWTDDYSVAKVVPLIALWTMRECVANGSAIKGLQPVCVVKKRVRNGCQCVEVQWKRLTEDQTTIEGHYITLESTELFAAAFPDILSQFDKAQADKKPVKRSRAIKIKAPVQEETPADDNIFDDSVILIPDDETEQAELETSFRDQPLTHPLEDAVSESFKDLAIDAPQDNKLKVVEIDSGRESPLPLMERLKLKYRAQGQPFPHP